MAIELTQPTFQPAEPTKPPKDCQHETFEVAAQVNRVALPTGPVGSVLLGVRVRCAACLTEFWFPGLPTGLSHREPTTGVDGFLATLPIVPLGQQLNTDPTLVSTKVRTSDAAKGRRRVS